MNDIFDTVKALHNLGLCVIPSGRGDEGKAPSLKWAKYQQTRPTDATQDVWHYEKKPKLYGIVTGELSSVVVVDCDSIDAMLVMGNLKPHVRTPRGGGHYYFEHPGPDYRVEGTIGILPKVDIRADGSFVNAIGVNPVTNGEYLMEILPTLETIYSLDQMPEVIMKKMVVREVHGEEPAPETEPASEEGAVRALDGVPEGERDDAIYKYACRLFGKGLRRDEVTSLVLLAASRATPPFPEKEALAKVKSASQYEQKADGYVPLRSMNDVEPREVEWLWYPYIPLGKLTLLEGDPGEGKSWVSLAIASDVSLGRIGSEPGNVLLASVEDDLDDTIRPRLDALGADLSRIFPIEVPFILDMSGFTLLQTYFEKHHPTLFILDPVVGFLGNKVDMHRANEVRSVMAKITAMAREFDCAILLIRHLTKGSMTKSIYRGIGSIDFTAASRSVLLAGHEEDEDGEGILNRALVHIKCNNAPLGEAMGYALGDVFLWTGTSTITAVNILKESGDKTKVEEAKNFLKSIITGDEQIPANEISKAAKEYGISKRTLDTAKASLKIQSSKDKIWYWHWKEKKVDQHIDKTVWHWPHIKMEGNNVTVTENCRMN